MSRSSHPPTLLRIAQRTIQEEKLIEAGQLVLAGVSGGPDSMAMLHCLHILSKRLSYALRVCGIDHGLRAEAASELRLVAEMCEGLGLGFEAVQVQVGAGANVMARAREQRHEALQHAAKQCGAERIALGHHANDRAETVLIRLLQGAGPAGLAAMPARAGNLIRPLVRAKRIDIEEHLRRHEIGFVTDPSNDNPKYLRARVRNELLPLMKQLSSNVVEHLCDLSDDLGAMGLESVTTMNRAQLKQIARGAQKGASVSIALPAGQRAILDHQTGRVVIETNEGPRCK